LNKLISKLKNLSPDSSELLRKGGGAFVIRLLGFGSGYVFLLMVTNWYGADSNGVFSLSLTFIMLITILSRMGMDTSLVKYTAKLNKEESLSELVDIYKKAVINSLIVSGILSAILYFYSSEISRFFFGNDSLHQALKIISIAIPTWTIVQLNAAIFRGFKLTNWYSFYFQLGRFLIAIIAISFVWLINSSKTNINIPVITYTIACVVMTISSSIHILKLFSQGKIERKKLSEKIVYSKFIKQSFPMMLSASLMFLMGWLSTLILGYFENEKAVGIFNVAIKISTLTTFVLTAINSIAAPKFSELFYSEQFLRFKKLVLNSTRIIFLSSIPILAILILFPEFILSFFGDEFKVGKTTLLVLLIGQIINSLSGSVGYILQMTGYERVFQNILILGLVLNIILCFIFIPRYGMLGAAWATSIGMGIWNLTSVYYVYKKLHILTIKFW
jgi:O-antigen/teichoic acid export membrane protein